MYVYVYSPNLHTEMNLHESPILSCPHLCHPFVCPPQWLKLSPEEVKEQIYKLAKKGLNPSQIGVVLRDSYGVAQVKNVTGNKILRILKSKGAVNVYVHVRYISEKS